MKRIKKIIKKIIRISSSIFIFFDIIKFTSKNDKRFRIKIFNFYPRMGEKTNKTKFDLHYIYHPAWAARILAKTNPKKHIDISSTLHFSTIISAFITTEFYDFRPADISLDNFSSKAGDLNKLPFNDNSVESLSCMHTIEHIGLGRYGDKIDPKGDLKAINELKRVLTKDGNLLIVVPIGKPNIEYNAHRIYSYNMIKEYFKELKLIEFSLISELEKKIIINASEDQANKENYGCGCFWFKK